MTLTKTSSPTDTTCSASSTCLPGELGDVHEALDAVGDADERTERNELRDLARRDLADRVGAGEHLPRVLLRRLERQRDALAVEVDVEHLDGDLLADLDDLGGVLDVLPRELGDVHEAVHAAQVDERAEVDDRGDVPLRTWPLCRFLRNVVRDSDCVCSSSARRESTTLLRFLSSSRIFASISWPRYGVRSRTRRSSMSEAGRKPRRPMSTIRPPLTTSITEPVDDAVVLLDLLDVAPGALVLRALLGQDEAAFLVLLLENEGLDLVADLDDLVGVDVVLDRELARGDDALGLVADVEQDLVAVDLHDGAFDDVAVVEELEGLFDRGQEVLSRSDVVDGDLLGGRGGRCGSHVVNAPLRTKSSPSRGEARVGSAMGVCGEGCDRSAFRS